MNYSNCREMQNQLSAQKTNIQEFLDQIKISEERIKSLEEEMVKTQELFTEKLEKTTQNLNRTIQERNETKEIVKQQVQTEDELYSQATSLLDTVEETVTDTGRLHTSLDRNKQLHTQNLESTQAFKGTAKQRLEHLNKLLLERSDVQNEFNEKMNIKIGTMSI